MAGRHYHVGVQLAGHKAIAKHSCKDQHIPASEHATNGRSHRSATAAPPQPPSATQSREPPAYAGRFRDRVVAAH